MSESLQREPAFETMPGAESPRGEKEAEPVITTSALARWYGPVIGLTDLEVRIPPGITGLLGPNGAGKSTFMRLLTGQIKPSSGSVSLLGRNPMTDSEVFGEVGFCSEDDTLFEDMTPREMVRFLARCSGFSGAEVHQRTEEALERTGIAYAADRRSGTFSKGMRQRTRLAAALVHGPRLLLLDEPMTGLDPVGRRDVVDLIRSFAAEGRSVLFSSHILHEVEVVAEHVVIMNRGMILAEGTMSHIQDCLSDYSFDLRVACDRPRELARHLATAEHVVGLRFGEGGLVVSSESAKSLLQELPALALELGISIDEIDCPGESLEALFGRLVP